MFYQNNKKAWISVLEQNWKTIKIELDSFLKKNKWTLKSYYPSYTNKDGVWLNIPLIFFTINNESILGHFPKTIAILRKIPELISAEFSILNPNTIINAHEGYSKEVMRTHLGLRIPAGDLGLKSNDETRLWREGETLSFNDGMLHEAWNKSSCERWILMIDTPIPNSKYTAKDIARYKMENLTDPTLLQIHSKEEWIKLISQ